MTTNEKVDSVVIFFIILIVSAIGAGVTRNTFDLTELKALVVFAIYSGIGVCGAAAILTINRSRRGY